MSEQALLAWAKKIDKIYEIQKDLKREIEESYRRELYKAKHNNLVDAVLYEFWLIDVGLLK